MSPTDIDSRSDVQTDVQAADQAAVQTDVQAEVRSFEPTLDGLCALAGGRGAVLFEPDGAHTIVHDLADLAPEAWVP
jgi:hypothetical protein